MDKKFKHEKAIMSVSETATYLQLSRSRFYGLIAENVFPPPIYDVRTRRPFYDRRLLEICRRIRETGVTLTGEYVLFYPPRQPRTHAPKKQSRPKKESPWKDIRETLLQMGLEVSDEQVAEAVGAVFPEGINGQDMGVVVREIFRFIKNRT